MPSCADHPPSDVAQSTDSAGAEPTVEQRIEAGRKAHCQSLHEHHPTIDEQRAIVRAFVAEQNVLLNPHGLARRTDGSVEPPGWLLRDDCDQAEVIRLLGENAVRRRADFPPGTLFEWGVEDGPEFLAKHPGFICGLYHTAWHPDMESAGGGK